MPGHCYAKRRSTANTKRLIVGIAVASSSQKFQLLKFWSVLVSRIHTNTGSRAAPATEDDRHVDVAVRHVEQLGSRVNGLVNSLHG